MMNPRLALISMDLFLCIAITALMSINHKIDAGRIERAKSAAPEQTDTSELVLVIVMGKAHTSVRRLGQPELKLAPGESLTSYLPEESGSVLLVIAPETPWHRIEAARIAIQTKDPSRQILTQTQGVTNG